MKNSIHGWKEIFSFTFIQGIKAKSIIISTAILCAVALASMPLIGILSGDDSSKKTKTSIKEVEIVDMTDLSLAKDFDILKSEDLYEADENKLYTDVEYKESDISMEDFSVGKELKDIYKFDEDSNKIYLQISYLDGQFNMETIYSGETKISESDIEAYNDFLQLHLENVLAKNLGVSEKDLLIINSVNTINYPTFDGEAEELEDSNEAIENDEEKKDYTDSKYNIMYALLMIILFSLAFCGERIAMSIITEKSSKVMEYLMTSVKPMAIVVGKILSNLLILFIQFGLILISFAISLIVNGMLTGKNGKMNIPSYVTNIFNSNNFSGANVLTFILAILIIIGGLIFYGLIAALAGASVSKLEEMSEGIKIYTILMIIGGYIALFIMTAEIYRDSSAINYIVMAFPLTSVFLAPGALVTGYLPLLGGIASLIVMIVTIILLTKFVANVYESMVYYNGTALKIKDIINISKQNKKTNESGKEK